jgi:hypothetical protein
MKRNLRLSWVRTPGGIEMKWTVETPTATVETPPRGNPLGAERLAANDRAKRPIRPSAWAARAVLRRMRPAS